MKPNCLLVKTAPDLYIKSNQTNRRFMAVLVKNIRSAFQANGIQGVSFSMRKGWMDIRGSQLREMQLVLKTVFGLRSVALAEFVPSVDLETVVRIATDWGKKIVQKGNSFAVDCSRSGNQSFSSHDIEVQAGAAVLRAIPGSRVDLENPDKTVFVNVQSHGFFLYSDFEECSNGLPVGCQGRIGFLLQNQKKDAEALWLLLRRGCEVIPIVSKKRYPSVLKRLEKWNSFHRFFLVQKKDLKTVVRQQNLLALATCDAVVSPAALKKIQSFDSKLELPVLRPLQAFDFDLLEVKI